MPIALKPTLEILHASDGATYLLRGAAHAEFQVAGAQPHERALLDALADGCDSVEQLAGRLAGSGHAVELSDLTATVEQLRGLGLLDEEDHAAALGPEAAERYDRQLAYFSDVRPGEASAMQARLLAARVAIVGVGGLGTWTAASLACSGVGHLTLVDDDRVELSNLNRQFLYRHADIGRLKVEAAAEALAAFDPRLGLTIAAERVSGPADAARLVAGHDFVVELADWPPHELSRWLDAACWPAGIPRVSAAQFPPRMRLGPTYVPGVTACLACQEAGARQEFPLYDELVAMRRANPTPAPALGPASALLGAAIAGDVVHHLTGIAPPATLGAALIVDLRDLSVERHPVEPDPACPRCGPRG
jgi:bacteriocin biosynthesis cyclodehydratase domain-containing protein